MNDNIGPIRLAQPFFEMLYSLELLGIVLTLRTSGSINVGCDVVVTKRPEVVWAT